MTADYVTAATTAAASPCDLLEALLLTVAGGILGVGIAKVRLWFHARAIRRFQRSAGHR